MLIDIIVGLVFGDEAKGKATTHLLKLGEYIHEPYTHCFKFNGGGNAGHSCYYDGKKFVTHFLPSGVFYDNVVNIIGPGCIINPVQFFKELSDFEEIFGFSPNIKVAYNAHVITHEHFEEDSTDKLGIGVTKTGSGPCQRDKAARTGIRAKDVPELKDYLIDIYDEFYMQNLNAKILAEGCQAFGLDLNLGFFYPYLTSSYCTPGSLMINGLPHQAIRNIWGIAKAYDTYVGTKDFQPEGEIYEKLQDVGKEYGATTGRKRKCNFLHLNRLRQAIQMTGVTHLVINKMDILQELDTWKFIMADNIVDAHTEENFKSQIEYFIKQNTPYLKKILYSYSPEKI